MGLFDLFSNYNRKLDAILSYDAGRNSGKVLITSNIATHLDTLEISLTKENDDDDWVGSFLYTIEYDNDDDDSGDEYKDINIDLTPGLPCSLDFSLKTISGFTLEKVKIYYEESLEDGSFEYEDMETFYNAFLDPKWNLEASIDGVSLGEIKFDFERSEITEYIESLRSTPQENHEDIEEEETI